MYEGPTKFAGARRTLAFLVLTAIALAIPLSVHPEKKKKEVAPPKPNILERLDYSKIVWPNAPAITRVKYLNLFSGEKLPSQTAEKKKGAWMDRLAGVATGENPNAGKPRFQLLAPYGLAVDSKGRVYVTDSKVGAVFIFDTQTKDVELIKHGVHARFGLITGLAIDDADRLFVSDSEMNHVLVFDPRHMVEGTISAGMASPAGLAIDNENRFLYVCDTELDQVLVYDADPPYKLLRKLGTGGKKHTLTSPGDFARPTNVAVDADSNLYVSDTFNDRVEIFDADGNFVRTFGKPGDGPGYFARPKGIAVDKDGHIWVADAVQDRVQVFTPEGKVLLWMGGHGILPGQFSDVAGLAIDKNNRIFTSEQYPGRVQMFQYFTDEEALAEKNRRDTEEKKKLAKTASEAAKPRPVETPMQKATTAAKPAGPEIKQP
jgi:DNA-binding beta-propeller fold protein YncE